MSGLKIVYEDIAIGAKADSTPSASTMAYADVTDLKDDDNTTKNYALCLPRYTKMDGSFVNVPNEPAWTGWVSSQVSNSNSLFSTCPVLTITFENTYSCVGLTFVFNQLTGDYPINVQVTWYNGSTQLQTGTKNANSAQFFFSENVSNFNKIVVTFDKTNKPYRPVFLERIEFGLRREYYAKDIENPVSVMEVSQISEVLSINTLDFTALSDDGISYMFQDKQNFYAYWNDTLLGKFYLSNGYRSGQSKYKIQTKDAIATLDSLKWYGGMYSSYLASTLIQSIFSGTGIDYELDSSYGTAVITGYMPISTRREALAHIGLVLGAIIDTSFSKKVKIYPVPATATQEIDDDDCFNKPSISYSSSITGFDVTCHSYSDGTETTTLYNAVLDGTVTITFSQPVHGLAITGGTIVESNCNYAIISGTGSNVTLSGYQYTDTQTVMSYRNASAKGAENVPSVDSATLINTSNGNSILTRLRTYYENNKTVSANVVLGELTVGKKTTVSAGYEEITGILQKATLRFGNSFIKASVEVR